MKALRIARLMRLFKLLRILRAGRMFDRWESSMAINYRCDQPEIETANNCADNSHRQYMNRTALRQRLLVVSRSLLIAN